MYSNTVTLPPQTMNTPRFRSRFSPIVVLALSQFVPSLILGQPSSPTNSAASSEDDKIVVMSPFTVSAESDQGYRATSTLAGTRINTSLRDIGTSIQAITPEFLDDTGITNVTELLLYTTSTEVTGGEGGNFTNAAGTSVAPAFFSSAYNTRLESAPTRIRGLANASISRNLFATVMPFDSYNVSRVEVNRGANSILFGLGSPAGIINYNLAEVKWRNGGSYEARFDNYGSFRTVLDINEVVVKNKLAFRVIGLSDKTKYKQDPSYNNNQRYFATVSYRPSKNTTLSASFEKGWINSSLPRQSPPLDYLTHFFTTGMVGVPNNTDYRDASTNAAYITLDSGAGGNLRIFDSPTSSGTNDAFIQYPDSTLGKGVVNLAAINPARANDFRYRRVAMQNAQNYVISVYHNPLGSSAYALNLIDPTVFDFFNNTIDGTASTQYGRITAVNVSLRQEFLKGNAGIEVSYDAQTYNDGYFDALDGIRGNALMLDISQGQFAYATPGNPSSGLALNPNYLRPNVGSRSAFSNRFNDDRSERATAFFRHDFTQHSGGFLAKLLGRQDLTMLASSYRADTHSLSGQGQIMNYDDLRAIGFSDAAARNNSGVGSLFYLGDSVAGRTTAHDLNLTGYKGGFTFADSVNIGFINSANQIQSASVRVLNLDNESHDRLATGGAIARDTLNTLAGVLQSHWWDGVFITTLGWREDTAKRYTNSAFSTRTDGTIIYDSSKLNTATPLASANDKTTTYNGVIRLNKIVGRRMPEGVDVDFHYGYSENFQGLSGARSVNGGFYEAPIGNTKELGFSMDLFNQKLSFRANWFETSQKNLADTDIDGSINTIVFQLPSRLYKQYTVAQLQAAGFAMPPSAIASGCFQLGPPNVNGFSAYSLLFQGQDIDSAVSKGFELEINSNVTSNWRMAVNVAKVQCVQSGKGLNWAPTVDWVNTNWFKKPSVASLITGEGGSLDPVSGWEQRAVEDFISAQQRDGASNPEIRKWRVNAITNYSFAQNSRLKGFGVGGGVRYQDHVFLGYLGKVNPANPSGAYIDDITKPTYGPSETDFDFWISYQRRVFNDKVRWKLQLNIRNAFTNDKLIPIRSQPVDVYSQYPAFDGYKASGYMLYRIAAPRTIELRSTFEF